MDKPSSTGLRLARRAELAEALVRLHLCNRRRRAFDVAVAAELARELPVELGELHHGGDDLLVVLRLEVADRTGRAQLVEI